MLEEPRRLVQRELPLPDIGDDDGLLRVEACGLCGTDHEQYTGAPRRPASRSSPATRSSASSRRSATRGRAVGRRGRRPGRRRGVPVVPATAPACRAGDYRRCERHGIADMYGFIPVDTAAGAVGRLRRPTSTSRPDSMLLPVPDGLDPVLATLFNPLGAGIRWGVDAARHEARRRRRRARPRRPRPGRLRRRQGGRRRVRHGDRRRAARRRPPRAGRRASAPTSPSTSPRPTRSRALRRRTGGLADVVVDVTAKAPAALRPGDRPRPPRRHRRAGRHPRARPETPGLLARPPRLQGAPHPRRPRRRRPRLPRRPRPARLGPLPVRRPAPPDASASTTLEAAPADAWPARATCRRPGARRARPVTGAAGPSR